MPLARQLEASAPCRRLHGVLGEGTGYTCIRRFKVDEKAIGIANAQRLKLLERLLDYCNAKLTLRESLFMEQDDLGRPRALSGNTVALDRDAARKQYYKCWRQGCDTARFIPGPRDARQVREPLRDGAGQSQERRARASRERHGRGRADVVSRGLRKGRSRRRRRGPRRASSGGRRRRYLRRE